MKSELLTVILYLVAMVAIAWIITRAFDMIEIDYDPLTGRQKVKMSKYRGLEGPEPLTLEGN